MYYKRILDAIPELIFVTKADGVTATFYNKTWYEYTGLTEKDVEAGWEPVVDPHDTPRISKIIEKAVENKTSYELELRLKNGRTGEFKWFLSRAVPVFDEHGALDAYVGISVDINDTKLSIRDMEKVYENEMQKRLRKIEILEQELELHKTEA